MTLLDFLRSYGKDFNINTMLAKDIVASRLDKGISFTEFAYQILQSIDFLHLFKNHNVQLQIGGADQWGNITSGLDLIRKKEGNDAKVFGLTIPLMLKADGTKFGKTAGGAIWLDPKRTSPYEFYQFWLNQDDRDVIKYLKFFTFLDKEEIDFLEEKVKNEPEKREAQKITQALFSGNIKDLTVKEIEQGLQNMPSFNTTNKTKNIVDWLVEINCEASKRQAREDVINGAININGEKVTDINFLVNPNSAFEGKYMIIRKGKRNYFLVKVL